MLQHTKSFNLVKLKRSPYQLIRYHQALDLVCSPLVILTPSNKWPIVASRYLRNRAVLVSSLPPKSTQRHMRRVQWLGSGVARKLPPRVTFKTLPSSKCVAAVHTTRTSSCGASPKRQAKRCQRLMRQRPPLDRAHLALELVSLPCFTMESVTQSGRKEPVAHLHRPLQWAPRCE